MVQTWRIADDYGTFDFVVGDVVSLNATQVGHGYEVVVYDGNFGAGAVRSFVVVVVVAVGDGPCSDVVVIASGASGDGVGSAS